MSVVDIYICLFLVFGSIFFSITTIKKFVDFSNFSGLSNNLGNLQTITSLLSQFVCCFTLLSILQYVYLTGIQFILAMLANVISFFLVYSLFSKKY